jgi:hypothetical protein
MLGWIPDCRARIKVQEEARVEFVETRALSDSQPGFINYHVSSMLSQFRFSFPPTKMAMLVEL